MKYSMDITSEHLYPGDTIFHDDSIKKVFLLPIWKLAHIFTTFQELGKTIILPSNKHFDNFFWTLSQGNEFNWIQTTVEVDGHIQIYNWGSNNLFRAKWTENRWSY